MNFEIKKNNSYIFFWPILGPLFMTCILFTFIMNPKMMSWEFPLVGLCGIVLCYQWKWKGLLFSVLMLVIAFVSTFPGELVWNSVLSLSILSTFLLTTLSAEEFNNMWESINNEKENQRITAATYLEQLQSLQNKFNNEQQESFSLIGCLKSDAKLQNEKLLSSEKIVGLAKDELKVLHEYQKKLLQDLYEVHQKNSALEVSLDKYSKQFSFEAEDKTGELQELNDQILSREKEVDFLKNQFENLQNKHRLLERQLDIHYVEIAALQESENSLKKQAIPLQEENKKQQIKLHGFIEKIETLLREKGLLESTLSRLQAEIESFYLKEDKNSELIQNQLKLIDQLNESIQNSQKELVLSEGLFAEASTQAVMLSKKNDIISLAYEESMKLKDDLENCYKEKIIDFEKLHQDYQFLIEEHAKCGVSAEQLISEKNVLERQFKEEINKQACSKINPDEENIREIKRLQGLYQQLRFQFHEKSSVLDSARRELFYAQEKLFAFEKEITETKYAENETEKRFYYMLNQLSQEFEQEELCHRTEINQLQELVGALLSLPWS